MLEYLQRHPPVDILAAGFIGYQAPSPELDGARAASSMAEVAEALGLKPPTESIDLSGGSNG